MKKFIIKNVSNVYTLLGNVSLSYSPVCPRSPHGPAPPRPALPRFGIAVIVVCLL